MTLIISLTTMLKNINFPQISLNQHLSLKGNTTGGKSSVSNKIRRPDSKNAINKMSKTENKTEEPASKNVANDMSKSEMVSDSATPASNISGEISKLETTTINLKNIESMMRES